MKRWNMRMQIEPFCMVLPRNDVVVVKKQHSKAALVKKIDKFYHPQIEIYKHIV